MTNACKDVESAAMLANLEARLKQQFEAVKQDDLGKVETLHVEIMHDLAAARTRGMEIHARQLVARYFEEANLVLSIKKTESLAEMQKLQKLKNLSRQNVWTSQD